jgi:SNF2 family DNA or RNA helicase
LEDGGWYGGVWPRQDTDLGYAAAILQRHHGFQLGWSRGLGKTLGTAAIIEANAYNFVVVAVPNAAKQDTWVRELERRLPTHQLVVMGNGSPEKRKDVLKRCQELYAAGERFVLIIHHEALALVAGKKARPSGKGMTILDGWKRLKIRWDLKVVDESHKLKTAGKIAGSQFHRAACKVPADNALALTGSIYENSWEEMYGTLHFLYPTRYTDPWESWNNRHLEYVEGYGKVFVGILEGHDELMRQELGVFTIIREKRDRAQHERLYVELSDGQRRAYDDLVETMLARLDDDTLVFAEAGVVQLMRLRQIATGLDLLTEELHDSSKIERTVERIQQFPEHDFFIATWHRAAAYATADLLEALGYPTFVVTGDVTNAERTRRIAAAREAATQRGAGQSVIVIGTIATLGESINLQFLNHVIRVELSFVPALNRQVVDRVDRTGQEREVYCDDIIAKGTVDETVVLPNLANKNAMRALLLGREA